jgi:hypothetical protein
VVCFQTLLAYKVNKHLKSFSSLNDQNCTDLSPNCVLARCVPEIKAISPGSATAIYPSQLEGTTTTMESLLQKIDEFKRLAEAAESDRAAMNVRFLELEDRANTAENRANTAEHRANTAEHRANPPQNKALKQQSIAEKTWRVMRDRNVLIQDAVTNLHMLPGHAIVPHMRRKTTFPSDALAITTEPSDEELEAANRYIKSLILDTSVHDFVKKGMHDAVAANDRNDSGSIWFPSDFIWGLERLADDNDAKFICRATLYHEIGHKTWFEFRGEKTGDSPASFKGTNSKNKSEGTEVIHLRVSPHPFSD